MTSLTVSPWSWSSDLPLRQSTSGCIRLLCWSSVMHVKLFHVTLKGAFKSLAHQIPCTKLLKFMCYHEENTKKMYISRVSHECYFSFMAKTTKTKTHISDLTSHKVSEFYVFQPPRKFLRSLAFFIGLGINLWRSDPLRWCLLFS